MSDYPKFCDVCDRVIFGPTCEKCGFDNSDQFVLNTKISLVGRFVDLNLLDDEDVAQTVTELFGLSRQEINEMIALHDLEGMIIEDY